MSDISCVKNSLIIFSRYPLPGVSKTRLIPALGPEGAAELQREMTESVVAHARRLSLSLPVSIEVHFEGGDESLMENWLGTGLCYCRQCGGDLGARMKFALLSAFSQGCRTAVIVGSDVPGINSLILQEAFNLLEGNDLVLGPAMDGGYYLVGVHRRASSGLDLIFEDIPWGGCRVFDTTLQRIRESRLSVELLEMLADIDRPGDLVHLDQLRHCAGKCDTSISVVMPALNEAPNIARTIRSAQQGRGVEVIVVDGGSSDETVKLATDAGARVISSPPGRWRQMNAGADAAAGDLLVFLHADTLLPLNYDKMVRQTLADPGVSAGAFSLELDRSGVCLRLIETMANIRSRFLNLPYGDQALFVSRRIFLELGGFPKQPIMEDFELVRRLGKIGQIKVLPVPVITSARRWQRHGTFRTTFLHQVILLAYILGVSPEKIACWRYPAAEGKQGP